MAAEEQTQGSTWTRMKQAANGAMKKASEAAATTCMFAEDCTSNMLGLIHRITTFDSIHISRYVINLTAQTLNARMSIS